MHSSIDAKCAIGAVHHAIGVFFKSHDCAHGVMCFSSQHMYFRFRTLWRVYAIWPAVTAMGQWPLLGRHNVPMYSCYSRVQQYCYHVTATVVLLRALVPETTRKDTPYRHRHNTPTRRPVDNLKNKTSQAWRWIMNISLCYCHIDAIELGLVGFTTQKDSLLNTATR